MFESAKTIRSLAPLVGRLQLIRAFGHRTEELAAHWMAASVTRVENPLTILI
jgi:hypothetical protein